MLTPTEETAVLEKTKELCSAILAQPNMGTIRKSIDAFMADEKSRADYETLMEKGQALHEKQHRSLPLSGEEISDFEKHREAVLNNPVARGFLDAQEALQQLQGSIQQHVSKTLELGRLPQAEDFEEHGCGSGSCGCKH
ncbi:MAG: YlbF family regulator [Verrucomicrobia bacterium]|nr:MAG: YlbF family regulator [Verrucomicrobiota bacterium]